MLNDPATNIRLENVERAVGQLTDRVGDIAKFMERLVSIEERNGFMTEKHDELKETLKEAIAGLNQKNEATEAKIDALKEKMIRMAAFYSVAATVLGMAAPHLLKLIHIGAAP